MIYFNHNKVMRRGFPNMEPYKKNVHSIDYKTLSNAFFNIYLSHQSKAILLFRAHVIL